ncbi:hypothetical protein AAG906_004084 [Vitis piasezkii]
MFFLRMQSERVWNSVEYGWGPLILDAQGRSIGELKPENEWDKANNEGLQIENVQRKHGIYFKPIMKNQESRKGKSPNEQSSNEKGKGSSKGKKVECFNYGGLGHYAQDCPNPKDIKKFIVLTTSKDVRYDLDDLLAFIASIESMNDTNCDSDNDSDDDEFIDEQRAKFLSNLIVEHGRLIKSYMKNNILNAHKNKIDVFNAEKTNLLDKIRFLESKHHSLLENNNVLTQEIKIIIIIFFHL